MLFKTRSSWLNCALRGKEDNNGWYLAVLSHYEADIDVIGLVEGIDAFIILNKTEWP